MFVIRFIWSIRILRRSFETSTGECAKEATW